MSSEDTESDGGDVVDEIDLFLSSNSQFFKMNDLENSVEILKRCLYPGSIVYFSCSYCNSYTSNLVRLSLPRLTCRHTFLICCVIIRLVYINWLKVSIKD